MAQWCHMASNTGLGHGLLPDGSKPLPEPTLTNHQCGLVGIFTGNAKDNYPWYEFENYQFRITDTSPWDQWVKCYVTYHAQNPPSFQQSAQPSSVNQQFSHVQLYWPRPSLPIHLQWMDSRESDGSATDGEVKYNHNQCFATVEPLKYQDITQDPMSHVA